MPLFKKKGPAKSTNVPSGPPTLTPMVGPEQRVQAMIAMGLIPQGKGSRPMTLTSVNQRAPVPVVLPPAPVAPVSTWYDTTVKGQHTPVRVSQAKQSGKKNLP